MYWFRLSRPASMYMVFYRLVGRGLRLQIPDSSPPSVAGETSGICNLRPWPTCPEVTIYIYEISFQSILPR